jgi:acetyl-CoA acetyltransferase
MRIVNLTTGVGALALTAAALGACGSHGAASASGYCQELKTDKAYFQSLNSADPDISRLDDAFTRMHSLAKAAPAAVAEPWKTLDGAVTTIEDALDEAGISLDDLARMQDGEMPDGVDLEKIAALGPRLEALGGQEVDDAAQRIAEHAKDQCGVDLQSA